MTEFAQPEKNSVTRSAVKKEVGEGERPLSTTGLAQPAQLQRAIGNRAVGRLLLQRKMILGPADDQYEREADAVAKEVVQKLNSPATAARPPQRQTEEAEHPIAQRLQRQELPEEELMTQRQQLDEEELPEAMAQRQTLDEEEMAMPQRIQRQKLGEDDMMAQREALEEEDPTATAQREATEEEEEALPQQIQRQELEEEDALQTDRPTTDLSQGGPVSPDIEQRIAQTRGSGRPLDNSIRRPLEQAYNANFSDVRIHTNSEADNLNQSLQARAFTTGSDVYFKQGEYNPNSTVGKELLAHELTHVLQQNRGIHRKANPSATNQWSIRMVISGGAGYRKIGFTSAIGQLRNRKTKEVISGYFSGLGPSIGLQTPGVDPGWGGWKDFDTTGVCTFSDFDHTPARFTVLGGGFGKLSGSFAYISFPMRGANGISVGGFTMGGFGAEAGIYVGVWKNLPRSTYKNSKVQHKRSKIQLESIQIIGDPNFYSRALRANQIYAKKPPISGWPYKDPLKKLWRVNAFDDFARKVRDIQEQDFGLTGKSADGILGPQTARLMNNVSKAHTPLQPIVQPELNSKNERMLYVMSILVNKYNYPENGAAGLVGNLYAESGLIANRVEGSKADTPMRAKNALGILTDFTAEDVMHRRYKVQGPNKPGVGLAQWTTKERRDGLFKHKYEDVEQGVNILFNLDAQIDYLVTELRSKYKRVNRILEDPSSSVSDASDEVLFNFERPAKVLKDKLGKKLLRSRDDPEVQGVLAKRLKYGEEALGFFKTLK